MNKKSLLHIFILLTLLFSCPAIQANGKQFTVVIDPGHGGRDAGAVGSTSKEKDIVLAVSLKLGKMISEKHKDVKVVYTRSTDKYITLNERANIANNNKGDLFISIHANSVKSGSSAKGTETFTLGLAKTEENLRLAMRENSAILLEEDYLEKYEGFNPNSSESYIIFEFMQSSHVERSIAFASEIEKAFISTARRSSRGVKQAGFLVLWQTTMPSVLVELGFISNKEEENFMKSADGQNKLATSIYNAFVKYKNDHDRKQGGISSNGNSPSAPVTEPAMATTASQPKTEGSKTNTSGKIIYKVQVLASQKKLAANAKEFKGYKELDFYEEKGLYKYTYGETTDFEEIKKIRRKVAQDFKDAFIVKFKDGKKLAN